MRAVLLAGGLGTRLSEETELTPKPMIEIGHRPMLWHIMKGYAAQDVSHFVVALGYKGEVVKQFFTDYAQQTSKHLRVRTATGDVEANFTAVDDWVIDLVDTGANTNTGGRLARLAEWLPDSDFCLTYGDGVSNVDVRQLVAFHRHHGRMATITAVRPPARFGGLLIGADGLVTNFTEKPDRGEGWINGGFMVFRREVLAAVSGDGASLERDVLEPLAKAGELAAYQHSGFWQCMDTLRDVRMLREAWSNGAAPWKTWT